MHFKAFRGKAIPTTLIPAVQQHFQSVPPSLPGTSGGGCSLICQHSCFQKTSPQGIAAKFCHRCQVPQQFLQWLDDPTRDKTSQEPLQALVHLGFSLQFDRTLQNCQATATQPGDQAGPRGCPRTWSFDSKDLRLRMHEASSNPSIGVGCLNSKKPASYVWASCFLCDRMVEYQ